ncbi:hypothetical protein KM043_008132 [Ampulex compressa]|nr:hypothetical protein KM043_008132 [Ampulex compressa]
MRQSRAPPDRAGKRVLRVSRIAPRLGAWTEAGGIIARVRARASRAGGAKKGFEILATRRCTPLLSATRSARRFEGRVLNCGETVLMSESNVGSVALLLGGMREEDAPRFHRNRLGLRRSTEVFAIRLEVDAFSAVLR